MKTKIKAKVKNKFKDLFLGFIARIASDKNLLDKFFGCILSPKEYQEIITRLQIFKMIREGYTQRQIKDHLKIGLATVSRGTQEVKEHEIVFKKLFSASTGSRSSSGGKGGSASGGKYNAQKTAKNKD